MMELFMKAAAEKTRFMSSKGMLTPECLFELPLTAKNGFSLDEIAKNIHKQIKAEAEESFVEKSTNQRKAALEHELEVVKAVIKFKQELNEAREKRAAKAEKRRQIMDAIEAAKGRELASSSVEDLEKMLEAL